MPRDVQVIRGVTTVGATTSGVRASLVPYDRITGAAGALKLRLSMPTSAANGFVTADIFVGSNIVSKDYVVPAEEFAGAGPNLRAPAVVCQGGRGDLINVIYRNTSATAVPAPGVQHYAEVGNVGR